LIKIDKNAGTKTKNPNKNIKITISNQKTF
jgi:hypothetical protein